MDYLPDGQYTLAETKAPSYHALDNTPHHITIGGNGGNVDLSKLTNTSYRATVALAVRTVIGPEEQDLPEERANWQLGISHPEADQNNKRITVNGQDNIEHNTNAQGQVTHPWTVFFDNDAHTLALTITQNTHSRYTPQRLVCTYTNTHGEPAGAHTLPLHNLPSNNGVISVQIPELRDGINAQCTFINARQLATLHWEKVDASPQDTYLGSSKWSLETPGSPARLVEDCDGSKDCDENGDADPLPGRFQLRGLIPGEYTLIETHTPAGYEIGTNSKRTFSVTLDDEDIKLGKIPNAQRVPLAIPLTGGHAADAYTITGLALIGLATIWVFVTLRSRKRLTSADHGPASLSLPTHNG